MIESLLGIDPLPLAVKLVAAFMIVLGLIGLATWIVRRLGSARLGTPAARGRQPRLAVIDAAAVDGRRRLVLIRRDNVEHLIMIGGPTDVVVEQNIMRAVPVPQAREATQRSTNEASPRPSPEVRPSAEPQRAGPSAEPPRRPVGSRPDQVPRAARPEARMSPLDQTRALRAQVPSGREDAGSFELSGQQNDPSLATMAQKLEAALRRPGTQRRSDGESAAPTPDAQPALPAPGPQANAGSRPGAAAAIEQRGSSTEGKGPRSSVFDSLEEEMASLLGKPSNKPQ
jgi:flagellar biogenesis protein FliO